MSRADFHRSLLVGAGIGVLNIGSGGVALAQTVTPDGNGYDISGSGPNGQSFPTTVGGNITSTASIVTSGPTGVLVNGSVNGSVINTGTLSAQSAGLAVIGSIGANLSNSGSISGWKGIHIHSSVGDSILNSGSIAASAFYGIEIDGDVGGDIINSGHISSASSAIRVNGTVHGNVSNTGSITVPEWPGIVITGGVDGSVSIGGTITSGSYDVYVGQNIGGKLSVAAGTTIGGSGGFAGITAGAGTPATSPPFAGAPGPGAGIYVGGTIGGGLNNAGVITSGASAPAVNVVGGALDITNTGTIIGGNGVAIDFGAGAAPSTINLAGGIIDGAIQLSQADMVNITGGTMNGAITGADATVNFAPSNQSYILTNGLAVGAINVQSGTLVLDHDVSVTSTFTNNATLDVASTRTITGNFAQSSGATLVIGVNNDTGTAGKLVVSQNASISANSSVVIQELGNTISGGSRVYTVVAAGGTGSYGGVNASAVQLANPFLPLSPTTSISGNDLVVTLNAANTASNPALGSSPNSQNVAAALNQLYSINGTNGAGSPSVLGAINTFFNNTASPLSQAQKIQIVSGQLVPSNAVMDTVMTQAFSAVSTEAVVDHLQTARAEADSGKSGLAAGSAAENSTVWGQVLGYSSRLPTSDNTQGSKDKTVGAAFGADTLVTPHLRLGGAFSYGKSYVNGLDLASADSAHIDSYQLAAYGSYDGGAWYVNGEIAVGFSNYNQKRSFSFMGGQASANYNGTNVTTHVDVGRDFQLGATKLTPIAGFTYIHQDIDGYTETVTQEHVNGMGFDSVETELGGQASWQIPLAGGRLIPTVRIGWLHDWIRSPIETTTGLGGVSFTTNTERPTANGADVAVGVTFAANGNWQLQAQYDGNFYNGYTRNAVFLNLRLRF
ncbi:MAG TPA: autotransporter domain-containing protein [Stellaceae bacterium]|nr:autotransporter domain-containing protein [Stellaceae bacterium]